VLLSDALLFDSLLKFARRFATRGQTSRNDVVKTILGATWVYTPGLDAINLGHRLSLPIESDHVRGIRQTSGEFAPDPENCRISADRGRWPCHVYSLLAAVQC